MFKGEKEKKKKNPDCAIALGKRNSNLVLLNTGDQVRAKLSTQL